MSPIGPVLLVDLAVGFGGAETRVIDTAVGLGSDLECIVAVISGSPLHERAVAAGVEVRQLSLKRGDPRLVGALRQVIRDDGVTVVDAHNVQSQLWGHRAARAEGLSGLVSTVHSEYRAENPGLKGRYHERVLRWNAEWGCRFIAVSAKIERYLRAVTGEETEIELIRRGFPVSVPPPVTPIGRSNLGWSDNDVVVGVIGRLAPAKGHMVLLDALAGLETSPLRCYLAGDGREHAALRSRTRELGLDGVVHFAGYSSDVGAVFELIDLLCLPSLTEGLPNVILEAASLRLPIVASAVGEIPELFVAGRDAWLVTPGDPASLAAALKAAVGSPELRRQRGDTAFSSLSNQLSGDWLAETVTVYHQAVGQ